MGSGFRL